MITKQVGGLVFKIEKNIPIPEKANARSTDRSNSYQVYYDLLDRMDKLEHTIVQIQHWNAMNYAQQILRVEKQKKFIYRKLNPSDDANNPETEIMIWRVEDYSPKDKN